MGVAGGKPTPEEEVDLQASFDANCIKAAQKIKSANILLLATGAGFSADSGLAVYKDIADVPAYHAMGLTYMDLCVPDWLQDDPEIFYGFWGMCFNDYRRVVPHDGYQILKSWKEKYFHADTAIGKLIQEAMEEHRQAQSAREKDELAALVRGLSNLSTNDSKNKKGKKKKHRQRKNKQQQPQQEEGEKEQGTEEKDLEEEEKEKKEVKQYKGPRADLPAAGPFFVYTSNVDKHSQKAGFSPNEVHEIHGNTETWQCSRPCSGLLWEAPPDFLFDIETETMRAKSTKEAKEKEGEILDHTQNNGFVDNHPRCIQCGALARPCILMFGDGAWKQDRPQGTQFRAWESTVKKVMESNPAVKMVIVEIGAGIRVPSVRFQSQSLLNALPKGKCTLIRINPDFPLNPDGGKHTISFQTNGMTALKEIDKHLQSLEEKEKKKEGK